MTDLSTRLEQAESGSRELDREIALESGLFAEPYGSALSQGKDLPDLSDLLVNNARGRLTLAPLFSTSLDAAMSLVPEGWYLTMLGGHNSGPCWAQVKEIAGGPNNTEAGHARGSLALALCASALRAQQCEKGQGDG